MRAAHGVSGLPGAAAPVDAGGSYRGAAVRELTFGAKRLLSRMLATDTGRAHPISMGDHVAGRVLVKAGLCRRAWADDPALQDRVYWVLTRAGRALQDASSTPKLS